MIIESTVYTNILCVCIVYTRPSEFSILFENYGNTLHIYTYYTYMCMDMYVHNIMIILSNIL